MNQNLLQNVMRFIIHYIWIFCIVLVMMEFVSTMYSATLLLQQTTGSVLQAQAGEISGRVDGVLRLLKGLAAEETIGNTDLPLYDRAIRATSYQKSYGLYMIAVLDKDFNRVPASATEPPKALSSRAERDYLKRLKATGTYQITDVIISKSDGQTQNYTIAVPLFKEEVLDGAIFGSIYLNDIEKMLGRENKGEFFLLGRDYRVMVDKNNQNTHQSLGEVYSDLLLGKDDLKKIEEGNREGDFWMVGAKGLSYIAYSKVALTEWTLVFEGQLNTVLPAVMPMLLLKIFLYALLCFIIARFGRHYLEQQLSTASHLMERVTTMQKELFDTEQGDYESILELTQQGLTDQLTGLVTRGVLIRRFAQFMEDESQGMFCFLDLDDLKRINDTFGHEVGDRAMLHFAKVLKEYEEKYKGIASRYGGDEFVLVLAGPNRETGEAVAAELCDRLTTTLVIGPKKRSVGIHASIGVVFYPEHGRSLEALLSKADIGLYFSKNNGKGRYSIFEGED